MQPKIEIDYPLMRFDSSLDEALNKVHIETIAKMFAKRLTKDELSNFISLLEENSK